jgi:hypothetical protein
MIQGYRLAGKGFPAKAQGHGPSGRRVERAPGEAIAGLWDEWKDKASGETLKSCIDSTDRVDTRFLTIAAV